jgi:hypothetical protein
VDPVTSENTTVTTFRCSVGAPATASDAPHSLQSLASAGFSRPQLEQAVTRERLERRGCNHNGFS